MTITVHRIKSNTKTMYVYQNFNKADKKRFDPLLKRAIQSEIANFAKEMLPAHQDLVEKTHEDIRVPFWKMVEKYKDFQEHMVRTYDGYSHRDLPMKVAASIVNGDLSMENITDFSEEGKQKMEEMVDRIKKWRED